MKAQRGKREGRKKEDCRPPCFHSDKDWNGPAAGNSETNNLSVKKVGGTNCTGSACWDM